MDSKGQTLVIFVLILPILLLLFALIWEVGNLGLTINKYETEIKDTIEYGLNHLDDENLEDILTNLLKANLEGDINVEINNQVIKVNVKQKYDALFNNLLNNRFDIDLTYNGYIENEKLIIQKE
ncbi:unknown [Firmicutes bacterium CAG:822]|nr:unknown [Firmicutes bacterium CAG:822]